MITFGREGNQVIAYIKSGIPIKDCVFHFQFPTHYEFIAELLMDRLNADFSDFKERTRISWKNSSDSWQKRYNRSQGRVRQLLKFIREKKLKAPKAERKKI